jgi:hypothetical protein
MEVNDVLVDKLAHLARLKFDASDSNATFGISAPTTKANGRLTSTSI